MNHKYHFSIGAVNISLRSACRSFTDEYQSLYAPYRHMGDDSLDTIDVEIQAAHRYPWRRGPFTLHSEGVENFQVKHRYEVLPHLEWYINWQIIHSRWEYLQLHASSLVMDGKALILVGKPGSGKTTLTAGLLKRGWSYLCDEFAMIDPVTQLVQPYPRALCIKEPSFPVIDRLRIPLHRKTPYQKATKGRVAFLNPLDVRKDVVAKPSPVRWVIFPRYIAGSTPCFTPLTRSQSVEAMSRQCFNFPVYLERAVSILASIARNADSYHLTAGEIESTCDLLETRLLE